MKYPGLCQADSHGGGGGGGVRGVSGYCVADASHVAMFSNFGGTCISDNQVGTFCWLWRFKSP